MREIAFETMVDAADQFYKVDVHGNVYEQVETSFQALDKLERVPLNDDRRNNEEKKVIATLDPGGRLGPVDSPWEYPVEGPVKFGLTDTFGLIFDGTKSVSELKPADGSFSTPGE